MSDIKSWFEPLLWIIGTIVTIGGFIRFCKPIWNFIQFPKQISTQIGDIQSAVNTHFEQTNKRLDQYDITLRNIEDRISEGEKVRLSLLHDSIVQIYQKAISDQYISSSDYQRACDLYSQDGNSPYIDRLIVELADLHKTQYLAKKGE